MKRTALYTVLAAVLAFASVPQALAVSKEIVQMQQQLDTLQQMVENMQKTLDTQSAVLRTLVEQASDNVNSMKASVVRLQQAQGESRAAFDSRLDSMNNQLQALSESLEEAKSRISKLSDQMAQTQNIIQTLNKPPATASGDQAAQPGGSSAPPPPDPDTLYKAALGDYTTGRYDLAIQGFQQYVQSYGDTDLASNAEFYIGDSYYNQQKYAQAISAYDTCIEKYPDGNKTAAAQLKKGYALLALGRRVAGERELRSLVKRFPHSHEASLAGQKLRQLGRGR